MASFFFPEGQKGAKVKPLFKKGDEVEISGPDLGPPLSAYKGVPRSRDRKCKAIRKIRVVVYVAHAPKLCKFYSAVRWSYLR